MKKATCILTLLLFTVFHQSAWANVLPPPRKFAVVSYNKNLLVDVHVRGHLLGKKDWLALKQFVSKLNALPTSHESLAKAQQESNLLDAEQVSPLLDEYQKAQRLGKEWHSDFYPQMLKTGLILSNPEIESQFISPLVNAVLTLQQQQGSKANFVNQRANTLDHIKTLQKVVKEAQMQTQQMVAFLQRLDSDLNHQTPGGQSLLRHWKKQQQSLNAFISLIKESEREIAEARKVDASMTRKINKLVAKWAAICNRAERGVQNSYLA